MLPKQLVNGAVRQAEALADLAGRRASLVGRQDGDDGLVG